MKPALPLIAGLLLGLAAQAVQAYTFGILPQRSAVLTAQYWNPILDYAGKKSGVMLELGTRKDALEYSGAEARGDFDFVYSNHILAPSHAAAGYRVIARPAGKPIHGQIVTPEDSPLRSLRELAGREVGFPNKNAFVGYMAPMTALILTGITVKPAFGGNQEGIMAQMRAGQIQAASVNSRVMQEYAAREGFKYRALWTSEPYLDIPISAHPRVPAAAAQAVRDALTGMAQNPEGRKILKASAAVIKQGPPYGFVPAQDAEYRNQREVYRLIWKQEGR